MNKLDNTNNIDTLEKLMEEANSLHKGDDLISPFRKSTKYQKFCPDNLMKKMAAIECNSKTCGRDIRFLVKLYLHLTSEERLIITTEGYGESQMLMKKYHIEKKHNGDNITLHRIAASFPILCVNLLRQYKIERKFSTDMLKEKNAGNFPWCMRTQMCLSLAPKEPQYLRDPVYQRLVYAIIVFMYYENKTVRANYRIVSLMEIFEKVLNIAYTIYNDSVIEPEKKRPAWNHVMFDYIQDENSVNNLLMYFQMEIPEAEATVMNRFNFIRFNKNTVYKMVKGGVSGAKK